MRTWTCDTCGDVTTVPVPGVNVVESGEALYCAKCARIQFIAGSPVVEVPSRGRMHLQHQTREIQLEAPGATAAEKPSAQVAPRVSRPEPRCGWCAATAQDLGLPALTPIIDGNLRAHRCPMHLEDALIGGNVIPGTNNV